MDTELRVILESIIDGAGTLAFLAYLLLRERSRHEQTREKLRSALREIADLRAILPSHTPPTPPDSDNAMDLIPF